MPRIFYPSVFNPPAYPPDQVVVAPKGWEAVYPNPSTRQSPRNKFRQPFSELFGVTFVSSAVVDPGDPAVIIFTGVYPDATRSRKRQQPNGPFEVPGSFQRLSDFALGGSCFSPASTPQRKRQQSHGEFSPPVKYDAPPNTTYGGSSFAPDRTRGRQAYQPDGLTWPPVQPPPPPPPPVAVASETFVPEYGAPVEGAPWEGWALEGDIDSDYEFESPPTPPTPQGLIEPIARVPRNAAGTSRQRRSVDEMLVVLNDLLFKGRIARGSDGMFDIVISQSMVEAAIGMTIPPAVTIEGGTGINVDQDATTGRVTVRVDDNVLRVQPIAGGASIVLWPSSTSDPSSNPSGGSYMWVNASGETVVRSSTGVISTIALA